MSSRRTLAKLLRDSEDRSAEIAVLTQKVADLEAANASLTAEVADLTVSRDRWKKRFDESQTRLALARATARPIVTEEPIIGAEAIVRRLRAMAVQARLEAESAGYPGAVPAIPAADIIEMLLPPSRTPVAH